jgi:hypothetical protein
MSLFPACLPFKIPFMERLPTFRTVKCMEILPGITPKPVFIRSKNTSFIG